MKKILFFLVILAACNNGQAPENKASDSSATLQKPSEDAVKKALNEVKKEPKIKEAIVTEAGVLYASVVDDGTSRNGYAQYLCGLISEYNTSIKRVKIVKLNSMNDPNKDNAYGVLLGEASCK